jgi:hypothetical protein
VIDMSRYAFEALRKDDEFVLYRGRNEEERSQVLVLVPATEEPGSKSLKRLEHEYSLKEDLERAWSARPMEVAFHWDRPVLVLEDPGGISLDQLLGPASDLGSSLRRAIGLATAIGNLHRPAAWFIRTLSLPISWLTRYRQRLADGLWDRIAAPT